MKPEAMKAIAHARGGGSAHRATVSRLMTCTDGGASIFGKRHRIDRVLRKLGVRPDQAIYEGDQLTDADVTRAAGVDFGAAALAVGRGTA